MLIYILSRSETLYTTKRIYQAGINRKHNVRVINYMECDLLIEDGKHKIVYEHEFLMVPDAVIPRIGSSVTSYGCTVVRHFERMGAMVYNKSEGILNSRDKFRSLQMLSKAGIKIPKTYFSYDLYYAERVVREHLGYPFVLKVLEGTQGQGVYLIEGEEQAVDFFNDFNERKTRIILQQYISEFKGKDIRVIVIGNKVVATMMRVAAEGDFRSNIHRGGKGETVLLSENEKEIAINSLHVLGLEMGGVDILRSETGAMIIEVNSSPGFEGIEGVTKHGIAEELIMAIENKYNHDN
ncbi:MAG: RimK family alpha-L-glutamate ligase [Crocinitomicaceae bacterium]